LKTEMTSVDVAAIVHELNQVISNARIENIYQLSPTRFLLRLHKTSQPTLQLLIEAGKRLHLTAYAMEKPLKPPVFCMTLRKHINNGIIEDIRQHEFERTITFRINTKQGTMQLIAELFGEGNIILTNQQGMIVTALIFKKMRDRSILRNVTFQHAPSSGRNPFNITREQLEELKSYGQLEIVRGLARFLSIGGLYAEEVLLRANVDKNTSCEALTQQQLDAVFTQLSAILSILREGKLDPVTVISAEGELADAAPIRLKKFEPLKTRHYESFNEALDQYYAQTSHAAQVSEAQRQYESELSRQQRMLQDQQTTVEEAQKSIERNKHIGNLIYSRLNELQLLQLRINEAKQRGEDWKEITKGLDEEKQRGLSPAIYFDSLNHKNMVLNVSVSDTVFPIQMNRSIQANAADYYERMKKAQRKLEGSEKAMNETRRRIEGLQKQWSQKLEETRAETPTKRMKKAWYEKFRYCHSSDGFLVLAGRDAITNEILIKKHTEPNDIVFHADIIGAPFVVVKTEGKTLREEVIQEAAQFAASYSRAWREKLAAIDVYWVRPNQVSKTAPSGQYLEKGAFVIQGAKNYIRKASLRVGIGLQRSDEKLNVVGGPVNAIRKHADMYVEVVPGEESSAKLARQIRQQLFERTRIEDRERISRLPLEEIQQFIPYGKGAVAGAK